MAAHDTGPPGPKNEEAPRCHTEGREPDTNYCVHLTTPGAPGASPPDYATATSLVIARYLVDQGLPCIPNAPGAKCPPIKWGPYQDRLPSDEELLSWFGTHPDWQPGIVCGTLSDLVVWDCDSAAAIAWTGAHMPPTPLRVRTGSGKGMHYYYRQPLGRVVGNARSAWVLPPRSELEADIRGHGGQVLAPGALHKSGNRYRLDEGSLPLCRATIATLPYWPAEQLAPPPPPPRVLVAPPADRLSAYERAQAWLAKRDPAVQGQAGDTHTYATACNLVRGFGLAPDEAMELLRAWNDGCQPPWSEPELWGKVCSAGAYGAKPVGHLLDEAPRASYSLALGHREQAASAGEASAAAPTGILLPSLSHYDLGEVVDLAMDAIARANSGPDVYAWCGRLARVHAAAPKPFCRDGMADYLARAVPWSVRTSKGEMGCPPPPQVVRSILARLDYPPDIPILDAVVNMPTVTARGELLVREGYHAASGLYLALPDDLRGLTVPARPTREDVREAVRVLTEPFQDFPFERKSDRALALAATLLPLVRSLITGPTPLHLATAPQQGSGKDKLITACCLSETAQMTWTTNPEEARKAITTALSSGCSCIHLANLKGEIDSAPLETVLTARTWTDRMLGTQQQITLPNLAAWVGSANNPKLSDDMLRRTMAIRLNAMIEDPTDRDFRIRDLDSWLPAHRKQRVQAALVIVAAWLEAGKPLWRGKPPGSYEGWAAVMGGVLEVAGVEGFLDDWRAAMELQRGEGRDEWRAFVLAWAEELGAEQARSVKDLAELCRRRQDPADPDNPKSLLEGCLPGLRAAHPQDHAFRVALGTQLREHCGRVYAGWLLERAGRARNGASLWRLRLRIVSGGDYAETMQAQSGTVTPLAESAESAESLYSPDRIHTECVSHDTHTCVRGIDRDYADYAEPSNGVTTPESGCIVSHSLYADSGEPREWVPCPGPCGGAQRVRVEPGKPAPLCGPCARGGAQAGLPACGCGPEQACQQCAGGSL